MRLRKAALLAGLAAMSVTAGMGAGGVATAAAASVYLEETQRFTWNLEDYHLITIHTEASRPYPGGRVEIRLWGDDPSSDDLLRYFVVSSDHQYFVFKFNQLDNGLLNEDWGPSPWPGDGGRDELYVGVRWFDSNGRQIEIAESNRITGMY
jgi:hypothetical protein